MKIHFCVIFAINCLVFGCGRRTETGISKIKVVNDENEDLILSIDYGKSEYVVPSGSTRNFLHGYEEEMAMSRSESRIQFLIKRKSNGDELGGSIVSEGSDDDEGDLTTVFPDGRKGLDVLEIRCASAKCLVNGKEMLKST